MAGVYVSFRPKINFSFQVHVTPKYIKQQKIKYQTKNEIRGFREIF